MQAIIEKFQAASKQSFADLGATLTRFVEQVAEEVAKAKPRAIAAADNDPQLELDAALWDSAPTVAVPKYALFEALKDVGHRFLATVEGLFVEVRRPWLHFIHPIAPIGDKAPRPPYGKIERKCEMAFGKLSAALPMIRAFAQEAAENLPNEHAGWIVWNDLAQVLDYVPIVADTASSGSVTFRRPELGAHQTLVVDLHSHGTGPAFFSPTDDADDFGEVKLACVIGTLGQEGQLPSIQLRLCVLGLSIPVKLDPAAVFAEAEATA